MDGIVLRSARNAYLVVLLLLVGISAYQFSTIGGITDPVAVIWVAAAGSFYLSKWYYGRQTDDGSGGQSDDGSGRQSDDGSGRQTDDGSGRQSGDGA